MFPGEGCSAGVWTNFTQRYERLLKLTSTVISKSRCKLFPNSERGQTLCRVKVAVGVGLGSLSYSVTLSKTCQLTAGEIADITEKNQETNKGNI